MEKEQLKRQNLVLKYLNLRYQKRIKQLRAQIEKLKAPNTKNEEVKNYLNRNNA